MEQDSCPCSAHPHPSPTPTSSPPHPPHSPTRDQWSSQPVNPSDKEGGRGKVGEGGGSLGAEGEGSPEKDLIGNRREDSC